MKTLTEYLKFHTKTHRAYVHITPQVEQIVSKSGVREGMVLVSAMHITAGVYVNDNESGLIEDIDQWLEHLAPFRQNYKHHDTGEDNGDSHLKALLIHHEVIVPITAGKLDLGTWQRIFYAEFDGQRDKRVIVKVMESDGMTEELTELQEHAEHAKGDPELAPVSVTMAILAVLVAIVTLLGHRAHTEEVVLQAKASDQWAYFQSKTCGGISTCYSPT